MKYLIQQLPISNNNIFRGYDKNRFYEDDYVNVWVDEINGLAIEETCDLLFEKFNMNKPKNFAGHSMSVSDLITFFENGKKSITFYCDSFGWKRIEG